MKLFLDTNVLVDYYARREPFFPHAKMLWIASFFDDVELLACTQSFADVEYILRRAVPVETLRGMMSASLDHLRVVSPTSEDLAQGLSSGWPDLEDFLIARCALNEDADYLITRDTKGFETAEVPVLSPKEFFSFLAKEHGVFYDEEPL